MRTLRYGTFLLVAVVLLLELYLRAWGGAERHVYDPIYAPYPGSSEIHFVHRPGLTGARGRGGAVVYTDANGLRATRPGTVIGPKAADELRIVMLGDSVTFGEGVRDAEDTFCQVAARGIAEHRKAGSVTVLNFGVSAYDVGQMTATFSERALAFDPDLALMALIAEDFDLEARATRVDRWGYTVNAHRSGGWLARSGWLRPLRQLRLAHVLRDLIHAQRPATTAPADAVPASYSSVEEFHALATSRGVAHAVVLLPGGSPFGGVPARLTRDGIDVIDLRTLRSEFTPETFVASRFDPHPSAAVHRRIGERLVEEIVARWAREPRTDQDAADFM